MAITKKPQPTTNITNCSFVAEAGKSNEAAIPAVNALARALEQQAIAVQALAKHLSTQSGTFETGIKIEQGK